MSKEAPDFVSESLGWQNDHMHTFRLLMALLLAAAACREPEDYSLDDAIAIASRSSVECGLGDQLHDTLWEAYAGLPVTLATRPSLGKTELSNEAEISFDADSFRYRGPHSAFNFSVTTGTNVDGYVLRSIRLTAAYQDSYCKESCVLAATYGDVMRSDRTSVRGQPLEYTCLQTHELRPIAYEWRADPVGSELHGEFVSGFRITIHAAYLGHTAMLNINPRGRDSYCIDGNCTSTDIAASDLDDLHVRKQDPATFLPSRFLRDHGDFPSDPSTF